jgi:dimethylamine monooxygenase subunit A
MRAPHTMIPAAYFPLRSDTFAMSMGTRPLEPGERLIDRDLAYFDAERALKRAQIDADRDEYVQLPAATRDAQHEAVALLLRDTGLSAPAELAEHPEPLLWFGLQVQEDLCLLDLSQPGVPLVAGVVCFPGDWSMREKLGKSFIDVHGPVPLFDKIGMPSVNLMERMKFDRPVWRPNWGGLKPTRQLDLTPKYRPHIALLKSELTTDNIGERLHFRVERQTLNVLPHTRHILFTIHTYMATLADVCVNATWRRNLRGWIETAPPEWIEYKGITPYLGALTLFLAEQSAQ